jgi:hypothetical protein
MNQEQQLIEKIRKEFAKSGGDATKKKLGLKHYKNMQKQSVKKRKENAKARNTKIH